MRLRLTMEQRFVFWSRGGSFCVAQVGGFLPLFVIIICFMSRKKAKEEEKERQEKRERMKQLLAENERKFAGEDDRRRRQREELECATLPSLCLLVKEQEG